MKKFASLLMLLAGPALAQPAGMVYHTLPDPSYRIVNVGSGWVIHDSRGFFVGHYRPLPPPAPPYVRPAPIQRVAPPQAPGPSYFDDFYSNYDNSYYDDTPCRNADPAPAPPPSNDPPKAYIPIH